MPDYSTALKPADPSNASERKEMMLLFISGLFGAGRSREKAPSGHNATNPDEEHEGDVPIIQRVTEGRKAVKKAEAEYESDVSWRSTFRLIS